jgi:coproporphyrinogen III oxidase
MNVRYFQAGDKWWFGGGIDLTPYYPDLPLIIEFHRRLKQICEESGQPYEKYKAECDEYFTLKHRNEMRGVGKWLHSLLPMSLRTFLTPYRRHLL